MECEQYGKVDLVRWWMLYTEERLISVVLKRRGGRMKLRGCLVIMVEDTIFFGMSVIRELLVFVAERWIDSVVNVVRVNERIMYVKLVIGKQIVNIVQHILQEGRL